ncbi:hypothetical protein BOX15_Mlig032532g1 [Macrostomum lignano]|uniref:LRAT domain-containing protein n=1 Tax=Macrostomum lignano TaxID=282301 RepID=A0A267GHN4_9PLAT|nr:hypothetical protein BOX15_Mlig032532g1 [Macrostomum lignano]
MASGLQRQTRQSEPQQLQQSGDNEAVEELNTILKEYHVITEGDQELFNQHKDEGKVRLTQENKHKLKPGDVVELRYYKLVHFIVVEGIWTLPDTLAVEGVRTLPDTPAVEGVRTLPDTPAVEGVRTLPDTPAVEGVRTLPDTPAVDGVRTLPDTPAVEGVSTLPDTPADFIIIDAIHYGRPNLLTPNRIIREKFSLRLNTEKCWLHVFPPASCYPSQTVLQRARSRLNEEEHSGISNNATMFALWCKVESPTHRPSCRVPIYLSNEHPTHTVNLGDHIEIKYSFGKVHAEITDVEQVLDDSYLATIVTRKAAWIPYVHESEHVLTEPVSRVISMTDKKEIVELSDRTQFLDRVLYPVSEQSSLSICSLLLSAEHQGDEWQRAALQGPEKKCEPRVLTGKQNPSLSKPGDIIHLNDVYRVVTDVRAVESGTRVRTVQYCPGPDSIDSGEMMELKCPILKQEKRISLCVHNEVHQDCELYGGGREKPSYTATSFKPQVSSQPPEIKQIKKGRVISLRNEYGFYKHAVVIETFSESDSSKEAKAASLAENPSRRSNAGDEDVADSPMPIESKARGSGAEQAKIFQEKADAETDTGKKLVCKLMSFKLCPSVSTEQFQLKTHCMEIDIDEQSNQDVHLIDYNVEASRKFPPDKVVKRALSRLGEREHDFLWNSDRDFARWCSIEHGSNREQCRIDIECAKDLVNFGRGHIKFLKSPSLYTHDAIMRECSKFEDSDDIIKVRLYENNHQFRTVRKEVLVISQQETVLRVNYDDLSLSKSIMPDSKVIDQLTDCTFLSAKDGMRGWTGKEAKRGSKVTSHDLCHWLKCKRQGKSLGDIAELFDAKLEKIQKDAARLDELGFVSLEQGKISQECVLRVSSLRQFDHIVLDRKVQGKVTKVHFILVEWDAESCTGVGVTYEAPAENVEMGFNEFNGFLRVTGPGQLKKVVHNTELDWEKIDAKFKDCQGARNYKLFFNNCEHFVNFLIYGRFTSLQLSDWALRATSACPSFAVSFFKGVGKFAKLVNRVIQFFADITPAVPDGKTFWSEGLGLLFIIGFSAVEAAILVFRKATTGMPEDEYRQRWKCLLSSLASTVVGLLAGIGIGTTALLPLTGIAIASAGIGHLAPRIPTIVETRRKP